MSLETDIHHYRMSDEARVILGGTSLQLFSGVVCAGKNTVITEIAKNTDKYYEIISHTTRAPRMNHGVMEQDGRDYYFITPDEAQRKIDNKEFIEVKYVHGNVYGTSVDELRKAHDSHRVAIGDVDVKGLVEYLDVKPDTHAVFLLPPSVDTWLARFERRYGSVGDHKDELRKRLATAYKEIKHVDEDKRFVLVINDDLRTTLERVAGILDGSVTRTSGYAEAVTEHLLEFIESKLTNEELADLL